MVCDLFLRIVWSSEEKMNEFFQASNDHIRKRYPHLFNQPERLNPEASKEDAIV